ncbi:hypothetical protein [Kordia sp.]|uniref:hypothetical protein n=1 Tax=Kordia sp. TaxID=1965332 RepID=UPI003D6B6684
MDWKIRYNNNKPLVNSFLTGIFYFLFCWSIDFGDTFKGMLMNLMLFLPGLTFPLTTCYYKNNTIKNYDFLRIAHSALSILIYLGSVWIFSGEGRIKYITILAGFSGSFLFLIATKYILKKELKLIHILLVAVLSGVAFMPYEIIGRLEILMGFAVFLWTVINGFLLNLEYKKE